jgi:predicted DNA-binding transcriptional regulator YafY
MADPSSRTLRLLSLLQTHRYWPGPELADRLDVSVRTLRRDVERLRELGYPVQATRGVDGGYQLGAGAVLPPLVVDDDEAVALAVGMQAATKGAVAGIEEAAVRALAKVVQVMPTRLRRRVDALRAVTVPASFGNRDGGTALDPDTLIVVAQACRDTERLEFDYVARGGEATRRLIEPHRLVPLGRRWYLVGYDLTRQDWRSFRVDRMGAARSTGARFRPRELPAADAAEFVRAGIAEVPAPWVVQAVVHAPTATVTERLGRWCTAEALDAGRSRIRITAESLDWLGLVFAVLDAEFEQVTPPQAEEHLRSLAARLTRATTPPLPLPHAGDHARQR